ncbi:YhfX family PLP-dependent enzyme [Lacticaseibacillus hegangensis]|uniref:YhfX family PLP-dependent enzyme n=1 Tax=Lacticaseibacillus hegangensis TaxID=2486010 RepID=A0ABW4CX80_9LACO|nr:YhfX family PLP-dependent enzyme [Lacticaseibacillus hegangensis]
MFLKKLEERNPELIDFAFKLHEKGQILPDTYVIDLDTIIANTEKLVAAAKDNDVELLYMTKQIGRNPLIAKAIQDAGISNAVVVDFREAETFMNNHLHLGNVGHLVQIPRSLMKKVLSYGTKYVTTYSLENTLALNTAAEEVGIRQKILIKVTGAGDDVYPGQTGGFTLEELAAEVDKIKTLSNIEISGLTTFPAILFDEKSKTYAATANVKTVNKAKAILEEHGITPRVISLPSATAVGSLPLIHKLGGNEAEPGHALTGTTPFHAVENLPEKPAYCYLTEVSHNANGHSFVYGGGYYRRGHLRNAIVKEEGGYQSAEVLPLDLSSIDYYLELNKEFAAGLPVVMASRTQIFVTRSSVAVVSGLHTGEPKLVGLFDSLGKPLTEGMR